MDSCQRRKPPKAVAEGQRLQVSIAPPQSSAEIGDMVASGVLVKRIFTERSDTCAGYARILAAANNYGANARPP
jgi:hypothetical protein